jgi:hypothetical protein
MRIGSLLLIALLAGPASATVETGMEPKPAEPLAEPVPLAHTPELYALTKAVRAEATKACLKELKLLSKCQQTFIACALHPPGDPTPVVVYEGVFSSTSFQLAVQTKVKKIIYTDATHEGTLTLIGFSLPLKEGEDPALLKESASEVQEALDADAENGSPIARQAYALAVNEFIACLKPDNGSAPTPE